MIHKKRILKPVEMTKQIDIGRDWTFFCDVYCDLSRHEYVAQYPSSGYVVLEEAGSSPKQAVANLTLKLKARPEHWHHKGNDAIRRWQEAIGGQEEDQQEEDGAAEEGEPEAGDPDGVELWELSIPPEGDMPQEPTDCGGAPEDAGA